MEGEALSRITLLMLLISMLTLAFNVQPVKTSPRTWIVDDDGPAHFARIQRAIDVASPGDTIYVKVGTYIEPQVTINKPLQLIGENKDATIVDGSGTWVCVYVYFTHNVNVSGFTIQNGYGIYSWGSKDVVISGNIISNNGQGIVVGESIHNTVSKNIVTQNGAMSIFLGGSSNNKVCENIVILNSGDAIWLENSHGNTISRNSILRNGLDTALGYHAYGIRLSYSNNNTIYHNNIVDNHEQASGWRSLNNTWDNGYPSGGNYWSDYTGVDADGDGIGDIQYDIDVSNQDYYPLMEPWSVPTMIKTLIRTIGFSDLPKGTENSLTFKLRNAVHLLDKENENGAIRKLMLFIDQVERMREKKLTHDQADYLVSEAQRIIDLIRE